METGNNSIRLIVEDHEDLISWPAGTDKQSVFEALIYAKEQIRKKYLIDELAYRDIEDTEFTLEKILETEQSPIFISLPQKPDVKTDNNVEPRSTKNVYNFKDSQSVRIQKFENFKKFEEVEMKVPVIKTLNDSSKKRNFQLEKERAESKQKILAEGKMQPVNNPLNYTNRPVVPNSQSAFDLLNDDLSKRQKVPLADGKSQYAFMKIAENGPDQSQKRVELQAYTIEEVKKHNKRQDAWMIIDNKVYDVTNYIPFHPGGDKILAGVGRDGTELFNKYHAWVNANFLLAKFQVGYIKK